MNKYTNYFKNTTILLIIIVFVNEIYSSDTTNDDYEENWFWNKEVYPNPHENPPYCRRSKQSNVCDPDNILTKKEANSLDELINEISSNSSVCLCSYCPPNKRGISIGIALMKHIYKEYNVDYLDNAVNFANFIRKKWNFGICDNDIVILVITSDDQVAISKGSITEKNFSNTLFENIFIDNKNYFTNGDYFTGLESMVKSYRSILTRSLQHSPTFIDKNNENLNQNSSSNVALITGIVIGFLVLISLVVVSLFFAQKRFNRDGSQFQFKGMLSKGYWLNNNERLKPVSVKPINTVGGVYEPCSIEDSNHNETNADNDIDKRLMQKLSQISECSSGSEADDEDIQVISHNSNCSPITASKNVNSDTTTDTGHTPVNIELKYNSETIVDPKL